MTTNSTSRREFWIGYPDAENPEIIPIEEIEAEGPRGARLYREILPTDDARERALDDLIAIVKHTNHALKKLKEQHQLTMYNSFCDDLGEELSKRLAAFEKVNK